MRRSVRASWRSLGGLCLGALLWMFSCGPVDATGNADSEGAFEAFQQATHDRYTAAIKQYERAANGDPRLLTARCRFIQGFADIEDLDWQQDAAADLEACRKDLREHHSESAEAQLFVLQGQYGRSVIEDGTTLLPAAECWPASQRAKLHELLASAYLAQKQTDKAGAEALEAAQLDRGTVRLGMAVEYLANHRRSEEAQNLLAAADAPKDAHDAETRVRAALLLPDAGLALRELERATQADQTIDEYVAAKVYLAAGRVAQARELLQKPARALIYETREQRRVMLQVAVAAGDVDAALGALRRGLAHPDQFVDWLKGYFELARRLPASLLNAASLPVSAAVFLLLAFFALLPGVLLVPVHYRGLLRRARGIAPSPLFARLGLRHAWIVLAAISLLPLLVFAAVDREQLGVAFGEATPTAHPSQFMRAIVWSTLAGLLVLLPLWRKLQVRELFGTRRRVLQIVGMALLSWLLIAVIAYLAALAQAWFGNSLGETTHTRTVNALTHSLQQEGGTWAAFLVVALLVPLYEELTFRGVLLGGLSRHISFGWANFWQALLFAFAHDDSPRFAFYLTMGLVCGWLARRTRGLLLPFVLHAFNNSFAVAFKLLL